MREIVFVGGIHGVGKGSICKALSNEFGVKHHSASKLIGWSEIKSDPQDKSVQDIRLTQERLLNGISQLNQTEGLNLLDGHFVLLGKDGMTLEKVSSYVFEEISPIAIVIITDEISSIAKRLENRDGREYDMNLLEEMQMIELLQANKIANELGVRFLQIHPEDTSEFRKLILDLSTKQ